MPKQLPILEFSRSDHFKMVRAITEVFGPRFVPDSVVAYADETDDTPARFNAALLAELGVDVSTQDKMPDVVLHSPERNWLLLVESVTNHGLVNRKRRAELAKTFAGSTATLIFVTAFPSRVVMAEFPGKIAWETVVWAAAEPAHLIHYNGSRLFGPYSKP
ncbi:MAG: hypothetical protein M0Q22_01765 [Sulfuritalea sp.]|jgi:hypothetical protein|nr:hypothetical protein [Sulfuritalea sp.]